MGAADLYECGACADLVIGVLAIGDAPHPDDRHPPLCACVELSDDRCRQVTHRGTTQAARLALVLALWWGGKREGTRGVRVGGMRRGATVCLDQSMEKCHGRGLQEKPVCGCVCTLSESGRAMVVLDTMRPSTLVSSTTYTSHTYRRRGVTPLAACTINRNDTRQDCLRVSLSLCAC